MQLFEVILKQYKQLRSRGAYLQNYTKEHPMFENSFEEFDVSAYVFSVAAATRFRSRACPRCTR
jgi:hypothetical protein